MKRLFTKPQQPVRQIHDKVGRMTAALCLAAVVLVLLFFLPAARESLKCLLNRLFSASEAVNTYVYDRFSVAADASPTPALLLLGGLMAVLLLLSFLRRSRLIPFLFALLLAFAEIWLGLTPPPLLNALLFALLMLLALRVRDLRNAGAVLLASAAVFFFISAVFPGVNAAQEERSELARDRLDALEQRITGTYVEENSTAQSAREENRLNEGADAGIKDDTRNDRGYQHLYEQEQQISRPQRVRYLKIILLTLGILALLTLPFTPFLFFNAKRKRSLARRAAFASPDCAVAIRAMFLHLTAYLEACGMGAGNRSFSRWPELLSGHMPTDYVQKYRYAASLFSEAAYSTHPMTEEQRTNMEKFLDETERILYDEAGWKQKLRLKYVECLHL